MYIHVQLKTDWQRGLGISAHWIKLWSLGVSCLSGAQGMGERNMSLLEDTSVMTAQWTPQWTSSDLSQFLYALCESSLYPLTQQLPARDKWFITVQQIPQGSWWSCRLSKVFVEWCHHLGSEFNQLLVVVPVTVVVSSRFAMPHCTQIHVNDSLIKATDGSSSWIEFLHIRLLCLTCSCMWFCKIYSNVTFAQVYK